MSSKSKRIVVAMSGGVDSSCAAYLLKKEGFETIGISMRLWPKEECGFYKPTSCCSLEGISDARLVAEKLDMPFYVLDFHEEFKKEVIDYFSKEYLTARTPNPCILCNEKIKFGVLLKKAKELGADLVATGHYARVRFNAVRRRYILKEGRDLKKDQSYVLFNLTQEQLSSAKFPLGNYKKSWVRNTVKKQGLPTYGKKDSQEICFIQDNYRDFLKKSFPQAIKPGPIVDQKDKVLGLHKGLPFYTVGQREGLGISYECPLYVLKLDKKRNTIVVGPGKRKFKKVFEVGNPNWIVEPKKDKLRAKVKIRSQHAKATATITLLSENRLRVECDKPQESPTPGQAAVFYDGSVVLGGGWIA